MLSTMKTTDPQPFLHWLISTKKLPNKNSMKKPTPFSNGLKRRELFTILSFASPDQEEFQKNKRLFWISIIFSLQAPWLPREIATSTLPAFWKEKVMVLVFLLGVWDKLAMQGPTLFGTLGQTYFLETETKLFTFLLFWSLIMVMPWMIRLYSELVKEFWVRVLRVSFKN